MRRLNQALVFEIVKTMMTSLSCWIFSIYNLFDLTPAGPGSFF